MTPDPDTVRLVRDAFEKLRVLHGSSTEAVTVYDVADAIAYLDALPKPEPPCSCPVTLDAERCPEHPDGIPPAANGEGDAVSEARRFFATGEQPYDVMGRRLLAEIARLKQNPCQCKDEHGDFICDRCVCLCHPLAVAELRVRQLEARLHSAPVSVRNDEGLRVAMATLRHRQRTPDSTWNEYGKDVSPLVEGVLIAFDATEAARSNPDSGGGSGDGRNESRRAVSPAQPENGDAGPTEVATPIAPARVETPSSSERSETERPEPPPVLSVADRRLTAIEALRHAADVIQGFEDEANNIGLDAMRAKRIIEGAIQRAEAPCPTDPTRASARPALSAEQPRKDAAAPGAERTPNATAQPKTTTTTTASAGDAPPPQSDEIPAVKAWREADREFSDWYRLVLQRDRPGYCREKDVASVLQGAHRMSVAGHALAAALAESERNRNLNAIRAIRERDARDAAEKALGEERRHVDELRDRLYLLDDRWAVLKGHGSFQTDTEAVLGAWCKQHDARRHAATKADGGST